MALPLSTADTKARTTLLELLTEGHEGNHHDCEALRDPRWKLEKKALTTTRRHYCHDWTESVLNSLEDF
jgi:hypothetical protein